MKRVIILEEDELIVLKKTVRFVAELDDPPLSELELLKLTAAGEAMEVPGGR